VTDQRCPLSDIQALLSTNRAAHTAIRFVSRTISALLADDKFHKQVYRAFNCG
jgi:hypothetical protein